MDARKSIVDYFDLPLTPSEHVLKLHRGFLLNHSVRRGVDGGWVPRNGEGEENKGRKEERERDRERERERERE